MRRARAPQISSKMQNAKPTAKNHTQKTLHDAPNERPRKSAPQRVPKSTNKKQHDAPNSIAQNSGYPIERKPSTSAQPASIKSRMNSATKNAGFEHSSSPSPTADAMSTNARQPSPRASKNSPR